VSSSTPTDVLIIIDAVGGLLSSVGAALAHDAGQEATAATTAPIATIPAEVHAVLAEVGIASPADVVAYERQPGGNSIYVGAAPPGDELESNARADGGSLLWVEAGLYDGPAETEFGDTSLERLACARILRDRLERAIVSFSSTNAD